MASPQKENGHLDLANELVEKLAKLKLSGAEWQILWVVWRSTWGWKKKEDWISLTQLEEKTGLTRAMICRAKKKLVYKRILVNKENKLMFEKNYEKWLVYKKAPLVYKSAIGSIQNDNGVVYKTIHTKEILTKEINTKEINTVAEASSADRNDEYPPVSQVQEQPFKLEDQIQKMQSHKRPEMQVIALYLQEQGYVIENKEQLKSFIVRNLRPAALLVGYSPQDIKATMGKLRKEAEFKWTLETVAKYIDDKRSERRKIEDEIKELIANGPKI